MISMQKLMSKSNFAKLANVNPSTVTRLAVTILKDAIVGKQVDANHPVAIKYLEDRDQAQTEASATGLDPMYEKAVQECSEAGKYTASYIQRSCKIGHKRAVKIREVMKINGLTPNEDDDAPVIVKVEPPKKPHVRGHVAAKETRKAQSTNEDIIEIPENIEAFADMTLRELIDKFGTDVRFVDWLAATQKIEAINEKRLKNATTKGELISRQLVQVGVIDTFNSAHLRLLKDGAKSIAAGVISKHVSGAELSVVEDYVSKILGSFIKPVKAKINRVLKDVEP